MINYKYIAIDEAGKTIRGNMSATNEADLEERLKEIKLDLVNFKEYEKKSFAFSRAIKPKDLITLCVQMEQLDRAGVPILDSLADMRDAAESPRFKELMAEIYEAVKGGKMLSEAMADHPSVFNDVFTGLVAAGERTGNLSSAFQHLAEHIKWNEEIRRQVKKATRYPLILVFMMILVVTIMMTFVVPKLSEFLSNQGFDLPVHTKLLIWCSESFVEYWYLILGLPTLVIIIMVVLYRMSEPFAYAADKVILKLPFFGTNIQKIDLARFAQFFGITFMSGIDILECLRIGGSVVSNRVLRETIFNARMYVSEGNSLTQALEMTGRFPSLAIRMFKVGEESGEMGEALNNINYFYEREVNDSVEATVELIQPALTIVMGGVLLWITAAVFGPLYDSFSKMDI